MIKVQVTGNTGEFGGLLTESAIKGIVSKNYLCPICLIFDLSSQFVPLEEELKKEFPHSDTVLNFYRVKLDRNYRETIKSQISGFIDVALLMAWDLVDDWQVQLFLKDVEEFAQELQDISHRNVYLFITNLTAREEPEQM